MFYDLFDCTLAAASDSTCLVQEIKNNALQRKMIVFLFVDSFNDLYSSFEVSRIYQKQVINGIVKNVQTKEKIKLVKNIRNYY